MLPSSLLLLLVLRPLVVVVERTTSGDDGRLKVIVLIVEAAAVGVVGTALDEWVVEIVIWQKRWWLFLVCKYQSQIII